MLQLIIVVLLLGSSLGSTLSSNCPGNDSTLHFFPGLSDDHQTGSVFQRTGWRVTIKDPSRRYLTFGPYTNEISSLPHKVTFLLEIDNTTADNLEILRLDVHDAAGKHVLVQREVRRTDFVISHQPQNFSLSFTNKNCSRSLEFRVYFFCCAQVTHFVSTVKMLDVGSFGRNFFHKPTQSHFQLISTSTFPTFPNETHSAMANVGEDYVVVGNMWYIFYREFGYSSTPKVCEHIISTARIVIRYSTDEGKHWSKEKWILAEPDVHNDEANCALVDGAAFLDRSTEPVTWHYLSQCLGIKGGWNMCHFSLQGSNPLVHHWIRDSHNPVVKGGQLWSQICAGKNKHCTVGTIDEGTPDIVFKKDGLQSISFKFYRITLFFF